MNTGKLSKEDVLLLFDEIITSVICSENLMYRIKKFRKEYVSQMNGLGEGEVLEALKDLIEFSGTWGREWFNKETWAKIDNAKSVYERAISQHGSMNNKQWPTATDNDFATLYRSLEVAVERLKHHEFHNREVIEVLTGVLNENKHFKL